MIYFGLTFDNTSKYNQFIGSESLLLFNKQSVNKQLD